MGDAVLVAAPLIGITVFAVVLIIRGSRREQVRKGADHAPWKVGSEPINAGVMVYLYREVRGGRAARQDFRFIRTADGPTSDWEERLLQARSDAEREASHLNIP